MRAVESLIAGVHGAEMGQAKFYLRGTSTAATVYQDFEGTSTYVGGIVTLNSYGQAEAYVKDLCEVRVYSVGSVLLRTYTTGDTSDSVEVMSDSFTGADYGTGALAAGNPTTLVEVLDLWETKNGGIDWEVVAAGVSKTVADWMGEFAGIFVNVKSSAYGAVGDGVANDAVAIQAAINAAAGGGTVVFPPGDYYCADTTLTLAAASRCSLVGFGAAHTRLLTDGSVTNLLVNRTAANQRGLLKVEGLSFLTTANGTASGIATAGDGFDLTIRDCTFGSPTYSNGQHISLGAAAATARVLVDGCEFLVSAENQKAMAAVHGFGWDVKLSNNTVTVSVALWNGRGFELDAGIVTGNFFKVSSVAGASAGRVISTTSTGMHATDALVVSGNQVTEDNGSGLVALHVNGDGRIVERGNDWGGNAFFFGVTTEISEGYNGEVSYREGRYIDRGDTDAATIYLNLNDYASTLLTRTVATAFTVEHTADPLYPGMRAVVTIRNDTVSDIADNPFASSTTIEGVPVILGGGTSGSDPAIHGGASTHYLLVSSVKDDGSFKWVLMATSLGSAF